MTNEPSEGARLRAERDELAYLLYVCYYNMHQTYANTSRRGLGIGGQTLTVQCSVISPEGDEVAMIERIERTIRTQFLRAESEGYDLRSPS
jgi:hypothetical protein